MIEGTKLLEVLLTQVLKNQVSILDSIINTGVRGEIYDRMTETETILELLEKPKSDN